MKNIVENTLKDLPEVARQKLNEMAEKAGMTLEEYVDYSAHCAIYRNGEEVLNLKAAA